MTEPYQAIVELLESLSATNAKKTLSRDKELSTKAAEQVTKEDSVWLQRIVENWNDYHVITAIQNLEYLVPLLNGFQRIIKKERTLKRDGRSRT